MVSILSKNSGKPLTGLIRFSAKWKHRSLILNFNEKIADFVEKKPKRLLFANSQTFEEGVFF
jgi:hypothetical protein